MFPDISPQERNLFCYMAASFFTRLNLSTAKAALGYE